MFSRTFTLCALVLILSGTAHAQFSGTAGLDLESASNIQRLDTTSPDLILLPAITLSYQMNPSAVTAIPVTIAWLPGFYQTSTSLSYNAWMLAVTPSFYLSNREAITREAQARSDESSLLLDSLLAIDEATRADHPQSTSQASTAISNEQLIDQAVTELYSASVALDSMEISHVAKAQIPLLEDLRDSLSEAAFTLGDLLDSLGYSEELVTVALTELGNTAAPLERLKGKTKPDIQTAAEHFNLAYTELTATQKKEEDGAIRLEPGRVAHAAIDQPEPSGAITLVSANTRLRDFGASDVGLREDLEDVSAKTYATLLSLPISYYAHTGRVDSVLSPDGNPNDSRVLSLGAVLDVNPSAGALYEISYHFNKSTYPYDSVYSNNENRLRIGARFGVGQTTTLFGDASIGFRSYTNTLNIVRQQGPRKNTLLEVGGDFTQVTFGLGLALSPSERFTIGGAAAFALNTNLRAYITNVGVDISNRKIRRAAQIADDEYTYDLTRGAAFATTRLPLDIDLGLDLAYEHRVYGTVANKQAQQFVEGAGRTDNGVLASASLSRIFPFEERVLSVFDGLSLEASLSLTNVNSTNSLYTYSDVDVLAGFTLSF